MVLLLTKLATINNFGTINLINPLAQLEMSFINLKVNNNGYNENICRVLLQDKQKSG